MIEEVAVALLFGIVAAGNDVHGRAARAEMIERGELTGGERRRDKARPMRKQDAQTFRLLRDERRDLEAVRRRARMSDQHAIETAVFMRLRDRGNVRRIDRGSLRQVDFARFLMADIADEFNAHGGVPLERWCG